MGDDLAKEMLFQPQAFDQKKLHAVNEPGVWSELNCYLSKVILFVTLEIPSDLSELL